LSELFLFAAGTYTEKVPHAPEAAGEGIHILSFNERSGSIINLSTLGGMKNPSYLCQKEKDNLLIAITESEEGAGEIQTYTLNPDRSLSLSRKQTGPGKAACHLSYLPERKQIFSTSYIDGCLKGYTLSHENRIHPFFNFFYSGSGPNKQRQESPHAHQALPSPDERFLYVCDLGSDRIWKHDLHKDTLPCEEALVVPSGFGPRHMAFDRDGRHVYILCELLPRLIVAEIDPNDGSLSIIQILSTTSEEGENKAAPAAIKIHPSGLSLAVSNRFDDTICIFLLNRSKEGLLIDLTPSSIFSCRGGTPRDICFSLSGKWLLIANQDSSDIQVKAFSPHTGIPEEKWGPAHSVNTPVCLINIL
jgi:6-phosphogluconolactonase